MKAVTAVRMKAITAVGSACPAHCGRGADAAGKRLPEHNGAHQRDTYQTNKPGKPDLLWY